MSTQTAGRPTAMEVVDGNDLTSLASVREAAAGIADVVPAVHLLHKPLGHFELSRLLTPQLEAAGGARVVNLSSDGHKLADVDLDDPNWERREYNKFHAYGASKTANILHAVELDRRLRDLKIRAYAVHPGMVATNLARHMSREDVAAVTAMPGQREITEEVVAYATDPDRARLLWELSETLCAV